MEWQGNRESSNVEDRRGGGGRRVAGGIGSRNNYNSCGRILLRRRSESNFTDGIRKSIIRLSRST
jgi:predicted metalloprotease